MEDQIFTPQETPTLDDVMNTEQEDVVYEPLDNVIDDEIHTQTEPSDVQIPESEEIETGEPIEVTIEDQIITPKKNRIDFQGYELDNISEADNENDVPSIKQVRDIVEEVESEKQDKLTAGDNITITDNVISATDTTYTAGDNISISDENVISATDTTYTAGSGLTLTDTEFSVGTITNSMIGENAVTSNEIASNAISNDKIIDNTIEYSKIKTTSNVMTINTRNLIGVFKDSNNDEHELYRIYYKWDENIPAGASYEHIVNLSDCYILTTNFVLYRSDAAGVISTQNDNDIFTIVFTSNGDKLRVVNKLSAAQTGTVYGVVECYKKTALNN